MCGMVAEKLACSPSHLPLSSTNARNASCLHHKDIMHCKENSDVSPLRSCNNHSPVLNCSWRRTVKKQTIVSCSQAPVSVVQWVGTCNPSCPSLSTLDRGLPAVRPNASIGNIQNQMRPEEKQTKNKTNMVSKALPTTSAKYRLLFAATTARSNVRN